jgi:hypothetical protein
VRRFTGRPVTPVTAVTAPGEPRPRRARRRYPLLFFLPWGEGVGIAEAMQGPGETYSDVILRVVAEAA